VVKEPDQKQRLKIDIFEAYKKCKNTPLSDDRSKQVWQFWFLIERWCKKHLFIKNEKENELVDEMDEKIKEIIDKMTKEDSTIKVFQELDEFFKYLNTSLKNAMIQIWREQLPKGVSREKTRKVFNIDKLIEIKQRERETKLTENERREIISDFIKPSEYTEIKNRLNVLSTDHIYRSNGDDDGITVLDFPETKNVFDNKTENNIGISAEELREAVAYVLENEPEEKVRTCKRSIFTAFCIRKEAPDYYLEELSPVLDSGLLSAYRENGIKPPTQWEIYLKYDPTVTKESAEVLASGMKAEFLKDLQAAWNEKLKN